MDMGFVATVHSDSSPCPTRLEQWDHRVPPKAGGSPFLIKVSESTPMVHAGAKSWLGVEEILPALNRSPLNPDGAVFELSSMASEPLAQFNNSVVGVFYGAKVSTPYKEEQDLEISDPIPVDEPCSKLQDTDLVVSTAGLQKSVPPMWEISEINSAVEESTPSLDVSISDLRFTSGYGDPDDTLPSQASAAPSAQWVGVTHKDIGRAFLRPFRYQRQLSASEIPIPTMAPPMHPFNLSAVFPDRIAGEWQMEVASRPHSPSGTIGCGL
ncbi:uncharacterized protein LOC128471892 [Spea bombifrons]|uniref:uncharacterized protein LOC128471892 n=1 Tax=Spea bombifrons TaxID=233779 RepID=UPI00234B8BBC|nr:uncharacterized protein LOC128471892 [Spea bombifrons]